ncbi:tetratricopeptide repeat protein [Sphingomonas sp. Leaf257]|uniref:tetratricopeptide repeat protein n=1 Tax=Sphingomonas sp. Leaf257 TaxID=1736309 RepID=UPI0014441E49|nr:tetratricopeptide repeat protein [Sphingomonas sp. Leaf257]
MSPVRSIVRPAIIVVGGVLLGWLVLAATMERIFARSAPLLALSWNPASADANVRAADLLVNEGPLDRAKGMIAAYAGRSLNRQPVNPGAARLLGLIAAQDGDHQAQAERLVRYAEAMSRRDLPTQMWLIESSVSQGDVENALLHYDRALKTNIRSYALLMPTLVQAANQPEVWRPLATILSRRPQWWRPFLERYAASGTSPDALVAFSRALHLDLAPPPDPGMLQAIEKRLVDLFAYSRAAALYNRAHGLAADDHTPVRNGDFERPSSADPFDWNLIDEDDLAAVRQPSPVHSDGNALFLSAANGRGGDLAVQLTMLMPGRYRVTAKVGGVSGDPLAFPRLVVRCAKDAREILHVAFPPAPDTGRFWSINLTVPTDCEAQRIVLRAASTLDAPAAAPWIDSIVIRPYTQSQQVKR